MASRRRGGAPRAPRAERGGPPAPGSARRRSGGPRCRGDPARTRGRATTPPRRGAACCLPRAMAGVRPSARATTARTCAHRSPGAPAAAGSTALRVRHRGHPLHRASAGARRRRSPPLRPAPAVSRPPLLVGSRCGFRCARSPATQGRHRRRSALSARSLVRRRRSTGRPSGTEGSSPDGRSPQMARSAGRPGAAARSGVARSRRGRSSPAPVGIDGGRAGSRRAAR
jgi:hypothetical protein